MARVQWRLIRGTTGHGEWMPVALARAWAEWANVNHHGIHHWVELATEAAS